MEKFKNWLIIGLVLVVIFLLGLRECNQVHTIITNNRDTIINIDSIFSKDTVRIISRQWYPLPKDSILIPDTQLVIDSSLFKYLRVYQDSVEDENIKFYRTDTIQGRMVYSSVSYKLKIPQVIMITKTITNTSDPNTQFIVGAASFLNTEDKYYTIGPMIGIRHKRTNFTYSYDIVHKTHSANVGLIITPKSKRKSLKNLLF